MIILFPEAIGVDVIQTVGIVGILRSHLLGLDGREGGEGIQGKDTAIHEMFADIYQSSALFLRRQQMHEAAAGDDGKKNKSRKPSLLSCS